MKNVAAAVECAFAMCVCEKTRFQSSLEFVPSLVKDCERGRKEGRVTSFYRITGSVSADDA